MQCRQESRLAQLIVDNRNQFATGFGRDWLAANEHGGTSNDESIAGVRVTMAWPVCPPAVCLSVGGCKSLHLYNFTNSQTHT